MAAARRNGGVFDAGFDARAEKLNEADWPAATAKPPAQVTGTRIAK